MTLTEAIEFFQNQNACKPALKWLYKQKKDRRGLRRVIEKCNNFDWLEWGARAVNLKAYDEAVVPHRKAYDEAVAPHLKAYREATGPHWKAYLEATAAYWKTYEEACKPKAQKILLTLIDK